MNVSCSYRFGKGKHEGGCGHGKAPKGFDTKGGCDRLGDACPLKMGGVVPKKVQVDGPKEGAAEPDIVCKRCGHVSKADDMFPHACGPRPPSEPDDKQEPGNEPNIERLAEVAHDTYYERMDRGPHSVMTPSVKEAWIKTIRAILRELGHEGEAEQYFSCKGCPYEEFPHCVQPCPDGYPIRQELPVELPPKEEVLDEPEVAPYEEPEKEGEVLEMIQQLVDANDRQAETIRAVRKLVTEPPARTLQEACDLTIAIAHYEPPAEETKVPRDEFFDEAKRHEMELMGGAPEHLFDRAARSIQKMMTAAMNPTTEEPGCPQSDAMGGTEEPVDPRSDKVLREDA